jgi:hypothetical protein
MQGTNWWVITSRKWASYEPSHLLDRRQLTLLLTTGEV